MASLHRCSVSRSCSALLLLAIVGLSSLGCQSDRSGSNAYDRTRPDDMKQMPAATSDGEFASMMAVHHESAIEMGRYQAQNGSRAEVRAIASSIVDAQSAENVKLRAIARETGHGNMRADAMMRENAGADMTALRSAGGAELDRVFLTRMIDHHTVGVEMTRKAMPNLRRDDTRRMAKTMIDDQTREIAQMRAMAN